MRVAVLISGLAIGLAFTGCGSDGPGDVSQTGGTTSTGGRSSSGGEGGGTGGAARSGGSPGSGGTTGSGGIASTGGTMATGGTSLTGGSGAGGTTGSGGMTGSGGALATGGATTSVASGGTTGAAGRTGTGGDGAMGGSVGRDAGADARTPVDTATCTPGGTCTDPDKTITSGSGKHCCYTYENWVGSGSATMTLKTDGFSVNWTGSTQFVGRKGIRPGTGDLVTEYSASFSPNGNSYLCLYGWTTDPLVEYYVVDGWGSWKPPGGSSMGTVTTDGGTYDIYKSTRTNQPSIEGTATFPQYWSVRQQKKTSGTITLANHIKAWAGKGMPMGTFYEVSMTVEGYQSSGTADVKFTMK